MVVQVFRTWTGQHLGSLQSHFEPITDVTMHPVLPVWQVAQQPQASVFAASIVTGPAARCA